MFTPDGRLREEFEGRELERAAAEPPPQPSRAPAPLPSRSGRPSRARRAAPRAGGRESARRDPPLELRGQAADRAAELSTIRWRSWPRPDALLGRSATARRRVAANLEMARLHIDLIDLLAGARAATFAPQEHAGRSRASSTSFACSMWRGRARRVAAAGPGERGAGARRRRRRLGAERRGAGRLRDDAERPAVAQAAAGALAAVARGVAPGQPGQGGRGAAQPQTTARQIGFARLAGFRARRHGTRRRGGSRRRLRSRPAADRGRRSARPRPPRDRLRGRRDRARRQGSWGRAVAAATSGVGRLLASEHRAPLVARLQLWLLLALIVGAVLFVAVQAALKGSAVYGDAERWLGARMPAAAATALTCVVLLAPAALPGGPVWLVLLWSAVLWGYGSGSEQTRLRRGLAGARPGAARCGRSRAPPGARTVAADARDRRVPQRPPHRLALRRPPGAAHGDARRPGGARADRRRASLARSVGPRARSLPAGDRPRRRRRLVPDRPRRRRLPEGRFRGRQRLLPARHRRGAALRGGLVQPQPVVLGVLPVRRVAARPGAGAGDRRSARGPLDPDRPTRSAC